MNIPTEFKGKVYFYWWTEYSIFCVSKEWSDNKEYIYLGESPDMHIQFIDPSAAVVESLEKQLATERAESQRRIAIIQGRIQELLAPESDA